MTVLMFANGELLDLAWAREMIAKESVTAVIAVDGGLRHLLALGLEPTVVIGDMDSVAELPEQYHHLTFPTHKDETDLELALLYAMEKYNAPIWLFATLGGRLDHMLANILLLAHPKLVGQPIRLVEPYQHAWLMAERKAPYMIEGKIGDKVSLIPVGGSAHIQQTVGLKWALQNSTLAFGLARGVSNVLTAVRATIQLQKGTLLCVHTQKEWQR